LPAPVLLVRRARLPVARLPVVLRPARQRPVRRARVLLRG
jgi:hypothetical protein